MPSSTRPATAFPPNPTRRPALTTDPSASPTCGHAGAVAVAAPPRNARALSPRTEAAAGRVGLTIAALLLSGCQSLLPEARDRTLDQWQTFAEARAAIDAIEPFMTTRADLAANGIDPIHNPAITILSYPDVVQRFSAGVAVLPEQLDPGVLRCLTSGKACTGYQIAARRIRRERTGNFWLDSLSFNRESTMTGWTFTATILFVEDLAVFAVWGGQPAVNERQIQRNPLGPIQSWGDLVRPRI